MLGYHWGMSTTIEPGPSIDFIKKIESDIQKSGFPLELHVLNICSTKNTGRMPNVRYEYHDELREIDLHAFFETIELKSKGSAVLQHTATGLIIECKKSSDKPWVFFSSASYAFESVAIFLKYWSDFDLYFSSKQVPSLLLQILPGIKNSHYAAPAVPRCISYYEAFKGTSSGPSEIYRAIDSVITYLSHLRRSRIKRGARFGNFSEFYLPIIILDGYLFEASVNQDEVKVQVRPHLQLRTFHRGDVYIIDVVTRDHFEQFFNELEHFHEKLVAAIRSLKFPSDFRAAVRARLKEELDPSTKAMVLMAHQEFRRKRNALRKSAPEPKAPN